MNVKQKKSGRTLKSDLGRMDSHKITANEYEELPELTDEMIARGTVKRAGRPVEPNPRRQVTIRLPESVLAAWKATGPGWQTRMAKLLSERSSPAN